MPLSEARKRANKKWNDENMAKKYDRVALLVPKGKRDDIRAHADLYDSGSVNAFINRAIQEQMQRDKQEQNGGNI